MYAICCSMCVTQAWSIARCHKYRGIISTQLKVPQGVYEMC